MLDTINRCLERALPFLTPASLIIGFSFTDALQPLVFLVPWVFACMTFSGSIQTGFKDLWSMFVHPMPILLSLVILHVIIPLAAWAVGSAMFPGNPNLVTGLLLTFAIPTGITSLVWVNIYRGQTALSLAIILIDTLLSPLIVPFTLHMLVGTKVSVDVTGLMNGLFWMVVFPSLLGMLLNHLTGGNIKQSWGPRLSIVPKCGVLIVMSINTASVAAHFANPSWELAWLALIVLIVTCTAYLLGALGGQWMGLDRASVTSLSFNSGMRNIAAGVVLAVTYFPAAVALPVLAATLFQQILASIWGRGLDYHYSRKTHHPG